MAAPMVVEYILTYIVLLSSGSMCTRDGENADTSPVPSATTSSNPFSNIFEPVYLKGAVQRDFVKEITSSSNELEFCDDPSMVDHCRSLTFDDVVTGIVPGSHDEVINYMKVTPAVHNTYHISHQSESRPRIMCLPRTRKDEELLRVKLVNSTSLLQSLGNKNDSFFHCAVVIFYAPWCMFCARVAPHYNALARAFPQLDVLAIDAIHFSSLNSRYGTIAVPNILVFYNNSRAVAKFNHTERTFENLVTFVSNVTGFKPNASVSVILEDYEGPLPHIVSDDRDWLLWLAWAFVIVFFTTVLGKSNTAQNIWNSLKNFGIEHQQHIN